MRGRHGALIVAAWTIAGCGGGAPPVDPHAIAGVVRSETNQPVARAVVLAVSTVAPMRVATTTDDHGGFALRDLPDGTWRMVVERPAAAPESLVTLTTAQLVFWETLGETLGFAASVSVLGLSASLSLILAVSVAATHTFGSQQSR